MATEYIELTKEDFEEGIFKKYDLGAEPYENNRSQEYQYLLKTSHPIIKIMVYSSVDKRTNKTRGVGEDAIRLVLWNSRDDRPLGKGKRIYRVTSNDSIAQRIIAGILLFMNDAPNVSIIDWGYVKSVLKETVRISSNPTFAENLLTGLEKYKSLTDGQLAYVLGEISPKGYQTMEAKILSKGWVYDPTFIEVEEEIREPGADENEDETPIKVCDAPVENGNGGELTVIGDRQNQPSKYDNITVVSDTPGMELIPTTGYPYKFEKFNPVQSLVYPFRGDDCNISVGANTSSGKTILAEIIMEECLLGNMKVLYTSPLKSLSAEKFEDWKIRFPDKKILMLTGDTLWSPNEREKQMLEARTANIIICTSELLDSVTRRAETEKYDWILDIGLVVTDESHVIGLATRGHAIETGLMRFTSINKKARLILLSATMPNVDQLGAWLIKLNQKETKVIFSTWRPVQLQMHYVEYKIERNRFGGESYQSSQEAKRKLTIDIIKSKPNEKFLVFVHDKGTGRNIVSKLKDEGIESIFHNADLDSTERSGIESSFSNRSGGLRVLISTSTLAYGRNLPARNVIIVGVHRGLSEVDELDILQESGRAGRFGIDDSGFVYLIIPEGTTETWKEVFRNPRPTLSVLKTHQVLAFHVLAEIQNRVITDPKSLLIWYSRSLAYFQGEEFTIHDAKGLLDDLEQMEMVINKGTHYTLTGLGQVSGWLYYDPYTIYAWYKNWNQLFGTPKTNDICPACKLPNIITEPKICCGYCGWSYTKPIIDDLSISWALTDSPNNDWGYIPREIQSEADEMKWKLRNRGLMASDAVHFSLAAYGLLQGNELEGVLKANARTIKYDIHRLVQALSLIDSRHGRWDRGEFWKILPIRIQYGIPEEMIPLVKIPGIGGVKARKLYEKGIKSLQDVIEKTEVLKTMFVPTFVKKIQNDARKIMLAEGK